ncbi:MAG: hypothetical protein MJY74_01815 [Bacteroidaceae bacterium]|nr:hypothetical protein [Bacteroidaceae bacterium]
MKKLEKAAYGLGIAVECIIVIEFAKELYSFGKSLVVRCRNKRHSAATENTTAQEEKQPEIIGEVADEPEN